MAMPPVLLPHPGLNPAVFQDPEGAATPVRTSFSGPGFLA